MLVIFIFKFSSFNACFKEHFFHNTVEYTMILNQRILNFLIFQQKKEFVVLAVVNTTSDLF